MLKKKLLLCGLTLFLVACGNEEATGEDTSNQEVSEQETSTQEAPTLTEDGYMTLSNAIQANSVWFRVNEYPERSTEIRSIHHYNDGEITVYSLNVEGVIPSEFGESVTIEEILEYSDDEIIEMFQNSYQEFVENGIVESFEAQVEESNAELESRIENIDYSYSTHWWTPEMQKDLLEFDKGVNDIFLEFFYNQTESEEYKALSDYSTEYSLDVTLDGTGNNVESQKILYGLPPFFSSNKEKNFSLDLNSIAKNLFYPDIGDYQYSPDDLDEAEKKIEEYINRLSQPIPDASLTLVGGSPDFEIFDTVLSGFMTQNYNYLLTRKTDESNGYRLDDTDVSHPNVTIEGEPTE